jgi:hypothetical protein
MKGVILNSGSILALSSGWNLYRLVSRVFLAQIPFSVWKSKRLVYLADRWAMGRDTIAAFRSLFACSIACTILGHSASGSPNLGRPITRELPHCALM